MALALLVLFSIIDFVVGMHGDEGSSRDGQRRFTYGNVGQAPVFIQEIIQ